MLRRQNMYLPSHDIVDPGSDRPRLKPVLSNLYSRPHIRPVSRFHDFAIHPLKLRVHTTQKTAEQKTFQPSSSRALKFPSLLRKLPNQRQPHLTTRPPRLRVLAFYTYIPSRPLHDLPSNPRSWPPTLRPTPPPIRPQHPMSTPPSL
jgi:hypothetical protein